jgi:TRAP-type C4-dicarboxylate transport system permease small subunit
MPEIFTKLRKIEPLYQAVYKITMFICKIFLTADILITGYIVLARYFHALPAPSWGEEIILTLMAYMSVLSAALAIKRQAHIRMEAFDRYLGKRICDVLNLVADIAVIILAVIMLTVGWKYALAIGARGTYTSMPWLSKFWQYFPVPLAGLAMIFFELERIVLDVEAFYTKEDK